MEERLLTALIAGVGAEAKYFLIAFIYRFGSTQWVEQSVNELAQSLGVTTGVASRARKALIVHQCLDCRKVDTAGRPKLGLAVHRGLAKKFSDICPSKPLHGPVLRHLFSAAIYRDYEANKSSVQQPVSSDELLRPQLRLLLATLFAHANELGLVAGVGHAQLRELLGEGEEKVERWLEELLQLGFIRRKIAGLSRSLYAGTKVTSSYILNLNHPGLAPANCCSPVAVFYGEAMRAEDMSGFVERFAHVQGDFGKLKNTYEMLVWKIYQGVSLLLSNYWDVLENSVHPPKIDELELVIACSFKTSSEDDLSSKVVIDDMCWWAFHLASWVKRRMAKNDVFASLLGRRVLAFPAKNRESDDSMTLVFARGTSCKSSECFISSGHVEVWEKEFDLTQELLSKHGLVSFLVESKAS